MKRTAGKQCTYIITKVHKEKGKNEEIHLKQSQSNDIITSIQEKSRPFIFFVYSFIMIIIYSNFIYVLDPRTARIKHLRWINDQKEISFIMITSMKILLYHRGSSFDMFRLKNSDMIHVMLKKSLTKWYMYM